jgi:signal transduction histidine kinase
VLATLVVATIIYQVKREKYLRKIRHLEAEHKIQEEKERIKRDLHDSLGSQLSSIAMGLNREMTRSNNQNLRGLQELADKAISELRDSLWVLDKEKISVEELEQRINTLFWQYQKLEIPVVMEFKRMGGEKYFFNSKTASHLFRIIQEVLHNAVKHSGCSKVSINLTIEQNRILLSMKDNGQGMTALKTEGDHFGLHNIQKRANQLNAILSISSEQGKGTVVELELQIDQNLR